MEVLGSVFVLGTVAAADVAAVETHAQMNPSLAALQALLTARSVRPDVSNRIKVRALLSHLMLQTCLV
jgi:hypothetical protein